MNRLRVDLDKVYDPESADQDALLYEVIMRTLEIPGVEEAVLLQLYKEHEQTDLRWFNDEYGTTELGSLPFHYVWDMVINRAAES